MSTLELVAPRLINVPPRVSSAGAEVADFMTMFGRPPDGEQRLALDCLLSEGSTGKWSALNAAILESRQNGKTAAVTLPSAMADLWLFGCELVVWTAHEMKTADKTFLDLKSLIAGCPDLSKRVRRIWEGNGNQAVELMSGARMEFHARSGGSGRGFSGDSVTFDEAQALQAGHIGALMPTLSTRPNPQVRYSGSAPKADSTVWQDLRKQAQAGAASVAWVEWSAERMKCRSDLCSHHVGTPGCQLDNRVLWAQANHTMNRRIPEEFIAAERESMPADEFAREILGWGEEPEGEAPVTAEMWLRAVDLLSVSAGKPAIGVDASPRLKSAAIIAATWRPDGLPHVEVIAHDNGADWVPAKLVALKRKYRCPIMIGRSSPAAALLPDLMKLKIIPEMLTDQQLGQGCTKLEQDLGMDEAGVRHPGDDIMTRALQGASSRPVGDGGWIWQRKTSTADICPAVAMTAALIGLRMFVRPKSDLMNSFG